MRYPLSLILLLFFSGYCAAEITQPFLVSEMQLKIVHEGFVETPTFRLERVSLELLMPQRDRNQVVWFNGDTQKDDLGNSWLCIGQRNPPRIYRYSQEFLVNVSAIKTVQIPQTYTIPDDVRIYLRSTDNIQSDDPEIAKLAESITNNSRTDFDRVALITKWVHDNVAYNRHLKNESKDAKWVLKNRVGTCDEFSTLFIALVRSVGIPAKFVVGYYHGNDRWEEHAFTEVYLGEWVPVDPTNLDVGRIDAAHIKFAVSNKNVIGSRIKAYGADTDSMEWKSEIQIQIINYTENKKPDYDLLISSDESSPGDSVVVVLRFRSGEYAFMRASLQPCVSDFHFVEIDEIEKDMILEPDTEKILYWKLDVAEDLKGDMYYNCPLILNSKLLELKEVVLSVDAKKKKTQEKEKIVFSAELSDRRVGYGKNETVFIDIKEISSSTPEKIGVISGDYFQEFIVDKKEHFSVSFKPMRLGKQEVVVYTSTGSVATLDYVVSEIDGIYIDQIKLPELIKTTEENEAEIWIKNNRSSIQEIKLYMVTDSKEQIKSLSVQNHSVVKIPLKFDETGVKRIFFRLTGNNVDIETIREVRAYSVPEMKVTAVYHPHKEKLVITLNVLGDAAKNIEIKSGNETGYITELIGEQTLEVNTPTLDSEIRVVYEDLSGRRHSIQAIVETKEESLTEKLTRIIDEIIQLLIDSFSRLV